MKRIAAYYKLSVDQFTLKFDGESLKSSDSATDIGCEDDDLLDIHVSPDAILIITSIDWGPPF